MTAFLTKTQTPDRREIAKYLEEFFDSLDQENNKTQPSDSLKIRSRLSTPRVYSLAADALPKDLSQFLSDIEKFLFSLLLKTPTPYMPKIFYTFISKFDRFGGVAAKNAKEPKKAPEDTIVKPTK